MNEHPEPIPEILQLVEWWEEFRREAYQDGKYWSVGFGHSGALGTPPLNVDKTTVIETVEEARAILINDLKHVASQVRGILKVELEPRPFWALVSLCFNTGITKLKKSRLIALINGGVPLIDAAETFMDFVTAAHRITGNQVKLRGLVRRRLDEWDLFITKDTDKPRMKWTAPKKETEND